MIYTYQAANYCEACGEEIKILIAETDPDLVPSNPEEEYTYDSGDYPKPFDGDNYTDSPEHCGAGSECFNALRVPAPPGTVMSEYVGAVLTDYLTRDGVDYVVQTILYDLEDNESWAVSVQVWFPWFRDQIVDDLARRSPEGKALASLLTTLTDRILF